MNEFLDKMKSDTNENDFINISAIGFESNTLYSGIYKKTNENVCLFKSPQLSTEHALEFINIYSGIKCDHILPIFKYYFHPSVTFITKFPMKGKPLPDILTKISEKDKLTILLQVVDTVRIFQSYNYYSTFFDINSIYVDEQNNFHIQFLSISPIYITQQSFSNLKMNSALIFNIMKTILGREKASFYFNESNFYQPASKILYYLIQQISKNNSILNVNIIKYEDYFRNLIKLANETNPIKEPNNNTNFINKNTDLQSNFNKNIESNENEGIISNENLIRNENLKDHENQILESQYLCAISGINEKKYLLNLANKNHPKGQFLYGYRMFNGIGIRKDQVHGAKYIKSAADSSYPEAQLYFSILLKEGIGVRQNMNQSMNYLKIAADNKNKEALVLYGHSISNTMPAIAVLCYKEAAARGSIEGFFYYLFSVYKSSHLKSGNKSNSCPSIINFNITFCSNIPIFKNSYKIFLNSMPLAYLKLMTDNVLKESYAQFLFGFFYNEINSIFLNPTLIEPFDIDDIYTADTDSDNFSGKEEIYLENSMKNGNLYATYIYAKILFNRGQIQDVYDYLKDNKDSIYKNIKYYYAKCLQNIPIPHKHKKQLKIQEMISEAANDECFEAIYEEGEIQYETDSSSSWEKFYQAAKSGLSSACLKYGKYIIKSNVNKGKYFLKLCANKIPEAEYILSTYSDNIISQMIHLKKAADKGYGKAAYSYGYAKYKEGDIETAMNYLKKSSDPSSFLYLAHCFYLTNSSSINNDCSHYIKLAFDSNISQAHLPYGICLYYGIGMNKNQEEAQNAFHRSLSLSDFIGIYNLAVCMEKGIGSKKMNQNELYSFLIDQKNNAEKNKKKENEEEEEEEKRNIKSFSTILFSSSSDFGLSYIYLYLGYLVYLKGDLKEAKRYFKNAASKGNMMAAILFAKCIEMTTSSQSKLFTALKVYDLVSNHLSLPIFHSYPNASNLKRKAELCKELLKKKLNFVNDIQQLKKIADEGDDQAQYFYGVYCFTFDDSANNKINNNNSLENSNFRINNGNNNNNNNQQSPSNLNLNNLNRSNNNCKENNSNSKLDTKTNSTLNNNNGTNTKAHSFNFNFKDHSNSSPSDTENNEYNAQSSFNQFIPYSENEAKSSPFNSSSFKDSTTSNENSNESVFRTLNIDFKNDTKLKSKPFNFALYNNNNNNNNKSYQNQFSSYKTNDTKAKTLNFSTYTSNKNKKIITSNFAPKTIQNTDDEQDKKDSKITESTNSSLFTTNTNTLSFPSKSEGIRYLENSASSGNDKAEEFLARCLLKGDGVKQDISRAVSLFVSASNKGNGQAKNNLGLLYKRGIFVCKDDKAAFELFKEAADSGSAAGLLHYAMCLMKGRGVELNISLALPPLRKAREQGVPRASYILGLHYLNSDPSGGTEGMKLIKEAANMGYKKAKLILDI